MNCIIAGIIGFVAGYIIAIIIFTLKQVVEEGGLSNEEMLQKHGWIK